jgi:hypothetical protein
MPRSSVNDRFCTTRRDPIPPPATETRCARLGDTRAKECLSRFLPVERATPQCQCSVFFLIRDVSHYHVDIGMRYRERPIASALSKFSRNDVI